MNRNQTLDALRGFAILTMILSGSIAFGDALPAWMYHAQVPPPLHKFDPSIPGITWVDLVFPFFLFSMGAAIPLSLQKKVQPAAPFWEIALLALRRYILLVFFALFLEHMKAFVIDPHPGTREYSLSILAFALLFFQFYKPQQPARYFLILKIAAFAIASLLLMVLPFSNGTGFLFTKSDIIIIVLGNMAFFGTIAWWCTRNRPWLRVALLPFVMAVFIGAKEAGSWNEALFKFSPLPWMYKFYYLKYLFIIIPGTFAGEWIVQKNKNGGTLQTGSVLSVTGLLSALLVIINVVLLFGRHLQLNLFITMGLLGAMIFIVKKNMPGNLLMKRMVTAGGMLLLLGLFFEAYEGGIKKDPSTYSYYFVTSGLAFFMLVFFDAIKDKVMGKQVVNYLGLNGQNPMIAYVAGSLLLTPLLYLTQTQSWLNELNGSALTGFLKGIIFTGLVSLITIFCTRRKWFWKT
jgi:predicted acyltransferase